MESILQTKVNFILILNKVFLKSFLNDILHILYAMKYVYIDESGDLGNIKKLLYSLIKQRIKIKYPISTSYLFVNWIM